MDKCKNSSCLDVMATCANYFIVIVPLIILMFFMFELSHFNGINITDMCYMVLGSIGLLMYWVFKYLKIFCGVTR